MDGTHPSKRTDPATESSDQDNNRQITVGVDGDSFPVVDVLTGRGFITGKSGSGKSNSASVVIEELLENGYPCLIVDTDGEYYGLKERYEMLHVGADEECDLQVGPEHAERLAELALEENVPIILDVSGFLDEDDANDLIRETARHLFAKEKHLKKPFLLVVEEVHEYIPEGGGVDETGKMLIKVSKRGRKRGLGIVGISQRPADVKKDFITQANWLVWHRLTWDNDTKVLGRVTDREYADAVADLEDGEAFVQTDWNDDIERIQFKRKHTFDAGATPGLEEIEQPELKSIGDDLADELEEITDREQRRQDRVTQLEQRLEAKEERIAELESELDRANDMTEMAQQFTEALTSTTDSKSGEAIQQQVDEIREQKNEEIRRLRSERDDLRERAEELEATVSEQADRIDDLEQYEQAVENLDELHEGVERMADALEMDIGDDGSERVQQKLERKNERIDDLESTIADLEQQAGPTVPDDYEAFVDDEYVQEAIEEAKADGSPKYTRAVVAAILKRGGPVTRGEIARDIDIQVDSNLEKGIKPLAERGIVTVDGTGSEKEIDFDLESVREIHGRQMRRERTGELMDQF